MVAKEILMKRFLLVVSLSIGVLFPATAQRTVPGSGAPYIGVSVNESSFGCRAGWRGWTLWGAWESGVIARDYRTSVGDGIPLEFSCVCAEGNVMGRIFSDRARVIGFYGGGGVFFGDEINDPRKMLPSYVTTGIRKNSIIYGMQANLEMELYVLKRLGLSLRATVPVTFSSPTGWIHYEGSFNIHYDF